MRRTSVRGATLGLAVSLALAGCSGNGTASGAEQASVPGYRVLRDVRLPGDTSRWDYQVYDPATRRLYLAHLGAGQIVVFDTTRQKVVGLIRGIAGVHGLALAPDLGLLFASATDQNQLVAIDLSSLKVVGKAPTGNYPDGVTYAPNAHAVFVSDEQGSGDTVVDARTDQRLGDIRLGSDIGNSRYDPATGLVYVAVGGSNELVAVDPVRRVVVGRYPLDGCGGAHGVQVDDTNHRIFVACEYNAALVVLNLVARQVTQTFPVGESPDVLAEDQANHRLYVASESGQVSVFDVAGGSVNKLSQGNAGPDAHSVAVDAATHIVYLPLTDVGGHPGLREIEPQ